ncbi:MAG: peptidoglycan DD-metalloendopeptidase family protein [Anaerolineaceae bacterium]|nr:peptidoglycan DD-metalloendopeptidase family protein [Anaerolineaceae bacterium]
MKYPRVLPSCCTIQHMRPNTPFNRLTRWLILTAAVGVILIVGYAAMRFGSQPPSQQMFLLSPFPTSSTLDWTPIAPFAQVDPAIIPYLQYGQPDYGIAPLQVLGQGIPPVGAYLPQTGNTRFEVMTSTPSPTLTVTPIATTTLIPVFQPSQTPTSTRTPVPTRTTIPTASPVPTVTPTNELVATVLAFSATVNAPTAVVIIPTITLMVTVAPGTECAPSGLPVSGLLTQRYFIGHTGIDIAVPPGTPVRATQSGFVDWAEWNIYGYGNLVVIHSDHFITYYGHNTSFNVKKGQFVNKGAVIAFSGSTGHSSGPHVHYETRINDVTVDPLTFESRGYRSC